MFIIGTLAISRLAGFRLRSIANTQAAVSNASASPQSGSRPTGGGALSPLRPGSPACYKTKVFVAMKHFLGGVLACEM